MRKQYAPQVKQAQSREEMASVVNQMLAELRTSHLRYYTPDEPAYYQLLGIFQPRSSELRQQLKPIFPSGKLEYTSIGIFTKSLNGKTFIHALLDDSPAVKAGLKVGDEILSVDDRPFHPLRSFADKTGQPVQVRIQRTADPKSQQTIAVTPKTVRYHQDVSRCSTRQYAPD